MTKFSSSTTSKPKAAKASKTTPKIPKASKNESKKDQIFRFICEQHVMEIKQVDKLDVAIAVGNKNPRSEGFAKAIKQLTKDDGLITSGNGKDSLTLTQKGIQSIPKDLEVSTDPSKIHDRFVEFIQGKAKMGSDKVRPLWEILMDRKPHSVKNIATELGYKNPRSFANTKIIQAMKEVGLVDDAGKGAIQFAAKVPAISDV